MHFFKKNLPENLHYSKKYSIFAVDLRIIVSFQDILYSRLRFIWILQNVGSSLSNTR